jgi:hypothetical protein
MDDKNKEINPEESQNKPDYKAAISTLAKISIKMEKRMAEENLKEEEQPKVIREENKAARNKIYENYFRRQAKRLNVDLQKSRGKKWSYKNRLGYRIVDANNHVLYGENYELTMNEAVKLLDELEAKLKAS